LCTEVAGEGRHGHQLAGEVLDPHLVLGGGPGESVGGPHPAVQRRLLGAGEDQRLQPVGIDQQEAGQGVGVDPLVLV
jgi:hypothetical protein